MTTAEQHARNAQLAGAAYGHDVDITPAARAAASIAADPTWRRFLETNHTAPAVAPAAMAAAGRYVDREYGETGYTIAAVAGSSRIAAFRVRHFDGSEFYIVADRYENVALLELDPAPTTKETHARP